MSKSSHKSVVQHQFGRSASAYATSDVHAAGESLSLLVETIPTQPNWKILDVATGAGHTGIAFAPLVKQVVATDITHEMLSTTSELALERGITNLSTQIADAESLPFDANVFDLVTCRLAFHHFTKQQQALNEIARVLKPGGKIGFTDNYTVDSSPAAQFYNQFERLRDPSHHMVRSIASLQTLFEESGLDVDAYHCLSKEFEFHKWADRQHVSAKDKTVLLGMLENVPQQLIELLQPRKDENTAYFSLAEVVIVATKS